MLLAVDVGNTNLTVGVFEGETLRAHGRFATRRDATADELGHQLRAFLHQRELPAGVDRMAVSCVVPALSRPFQEAAQVYFGVVAHVVGPGTRTGMRIQYDPPRDVGADRIVTAVGVLHRYGGPAIIIDFGTATTFDAIDARGDYLGGAIAPGLQVSVDALFAHAARLPRVELEAPDTVLGRTTVTSMQAGVVWGTVGQVEGLVARMRAEMEGTPMVIATGGLAELIAPLTTCVDRVDPWITLEGLRLIADQNPQPR
ncbi:MAG TPA: type III pantothenate kinase [Candidatus Dormibacteraeota bacterium]|nr:type III pantothenate kinase [Candidatus Dormibacteraeota bacterium]